MSVSERVQNAAEKDELIIGTNETIDNMDAVDTVVVASNAPADLRDAVSDAADEHDTAIEPVDLDNRELGSLCMKPFTASVVGITE